MIINKNATETCNRLRSSPKPKSKYTMDCEQRAMGNWQWATDNWYMKIAKLKQQLELNNKEFTHIMYPRCSLLRYIRAFILHFFKSNLAPKNSYAYRIQAKQMIKHLHIIIISKNVMLYAAISNDKEK